jgi:hypothetical protein
MDLENVPRCQHIKVNGTQCGSPALRNRRLCFFHDRIRRERAKIAADVSAPHRFDLPLLEDANAVQIALMKVIQMLGAGRMDHKTAGLMLYALQTASANLRIADLEADDATDVVVDRDTVNATCLNGPQWFEEDFEDRMGSDEEDTEEEDADEEDEDEAEDAVQTAPRLVPKEPEEVQPISIEEARMRVKGVIRDWFLTVVCQKPLPDPGSFGEVVVKEIAADDPGN